jgi:hypothetical protein
MKVLFFMRSTVYVRNFESTLRLLADRGHDVHVVADPHLPESNDLIRRLCHGNPRLSHSDAPVVKFNAWSYLGIELRRGVDYLRYLRPEFDDAPKLRQRAQKKAPPFITELLRRRWLASPAGRRLLSRVLRWLDRAVPPDPALVDFIRDEKPDLVLATPLVVPGSPQAEYLRAASALGIPTGLCVYSWDNLTNKGLIHGDPQFVTVWNDAMKSEAVRLHGIPADRVFVTGTAAYDQWFDWRPSESRMTFCARIGLPADRPYLLYLCSSQFIAPNEVPYVRRWVAELRAASPRLRDVGLLVRPHPQNTDDWKSADFSDIDQLVIWPRAGANPVDVDSRSDFFHSIYFSAAVVGVNTSAQIESAVVGRGVYTVLAPEFKDTQEGTLHFRHLRSVNGGVLHVAETFVEHAAQLEAAIANPDNDERCRRFVEAFVRPHGIDVSVTPRLVSILEDAAARGRRTPQTGPWYQPLVRPLLKRLAVRAAQTGPARKVKAKRQTRLKELRDATRTSRREQAISAKQAQEERKQAAARRDSQHEARQAAEGAAYANYLRVRAWAAGLRNNGAGQVSLTSVERQRVARLGHLWDADPSTIATLRRWCEPISGLGPEDFTDVRSDHAQRLKRAVGFLRRQAGPDLFVPESPLLGGFGFEWRRERYNDDTVKHFKALVALQDGGVLAECRAESSRRLVWEIGGGWGGFAFQFKTVCPHVTYVISGLPELLLVSAVYLMSVFPHARVRFYGEGPSLWKNWEEADFIFVPESAIGAIPMLPVHVMIDLMALEAMSAARVEVHVRRAFDLGGRYFYSMAAGPSFPDSPPAVWREIERLYWPHLIPPRLEAAMFEGLAAGRAPRVDDYAHLIGWRRILV